MFSAEMELKKLRKENRKSMAMSAAIFVMCLIAYILYYSLKS